MPPQTNPDSASDVDLLRPVGLWAADCAERVLPLFEAQAPSDTRPREAIECIRTFGNGGPRNKQLRVVALAALAAAREVDDPAATSAARAACLAASSAYTHLDLDSPEQVKHVLGPAVYAAQAREIAAEGDTSAAEDEIRWAIEQATPAIRKVVRQMPAPNVSRTRLSTLFQLADAALR
ncbi:putative immunity protein [Saccharopolyspora taberi]|uniref:Imm-5-like domain-containing protein n=1 Tax=Saccharopolyspora taberi TaxID=60895 RepID=A0ABN3VD43_9PSEU